MNISRNTSFTSIYASDLLETLNESSQDGHSLLLIFPRIVKFAQMCPKFGKPGSVNGISNIWSSIARFGFEQISRDPGLDLPGWANRFEAKYSNIWCDYLIWHRYLQNSWWPIISLIFSHKLTSSHSDWSVQTQCNSYPHHHFFLHKQLDQEAPFPSINNFTSKFIEINGNPSILYVIDCTRTHCDTQINEIIKITNRINLFILPHH